MEEDEELVRNQIQLVGKLQGMEFGQKGDEGVRMEGLGVHALFHGIACTPFRL